MDLADFFGVPRAIVVAGEPYLAAHLKVREWARLQAFVKETTARPEAALADPRLAALPVPEREAIRARLLRMEAAWPPRVGSPRWFDAILTESGLPLFLWTCLRGHNPGFAEGDAESLAARVTTEDVFGLFLFAMGLREPNEPPPTTPAPDVDPETLEGPDDFGPTAFELTGLGVTPDEIGEMTYPQLRNHRHAGKSPRRKAAGRRSFGSLKEAMAWRESQRGET